jgi:hypothetical protein
VLVISQQVWGCFGHLEAGLATAAQPKWRNRRGLYLGNAQHTHLPTLTLREGQGDSEFFIQQGISSYQNPITVLSHTVPRL